MKTVYKIFAPLLRAVGFVGLFIGLFYFFVLVFTSGIKDALRYGVIGLVSLVMIKIGDLLRKKSEGL